MAQSPGLPESDAPRESLLWVVCPPVVVVLIAAGMSVLGLTLMLTGCGDWPW